MFFPCGILSYRCLDHSACFGPVDVRYKFSLALKSQTSSTSPRRTTLLDGAYQRTWFKMVYGWLTTCWLYDVGVSTWPGSLMLRWVEPFPQQASAVWCVPFSHEIGMRRFCLLGPVNASTYADMSQVQEHFSVPINSTIMVGLIWHFKPTMEVFLYIFMLF